MVSFPVKLYSAARSESISFNQLHKQDGSRVKQVLYCQAEDKPIPRNEIVKGFEYEKDRYVVVDDEEIKKVAPQTAKVIEIQEFVKDEEVDPVYLETSYYMAPEDAGEKPYALFFDALKASIIQRMIFHHHRQTFYVRVKGGTLRNGPGLQGAIDLQAEIIMEVRGVMTLDAKSQRILRWVRCCRLALARSGFRRLAEFPLLDIFFQGHGFSGYRSGGQGADTKPEPNV